MRTFAILAAVFGALAVACGAFGVHALRGQIDETSLHTWHTAVEYQMWHALALLIVATSLRALRHARLIAALFCVGSVLFCGSLYALALGAPHVAGMITPLGGVAFIAAWVMLAVGLWASRDA